MDKAFSFLFTAMGGVRKILAGLLLLFTTYQTFATHIVGGVMNYRYLGNDDFEINLSVYRDCKRGIPPLDPDALIWVWNHDIPDVFLTTYFTIPFDSVLDATIKDPCALIQPDECVNWTRYSGIINLPPNNTGYTVYYQRCCRNNSILNITRSPFSGEIEWGSTYSVNIPPGINGEHVINNSPVFVNYPPVYICQGKPIDYNHVAVDDDGDRLVYRLCTPVTGASVFDPTNYFTLEPPPFDTVVWNSPYNLDNVLGGIPLSIDSITGVMSGTPNTIGQFVVGVCVDEYRNGSILTRTVRDFQFNVVNCGLQVVSSFFAPDLECNSLTVFFDNQSVGADRYYWDFGDGDTSTLEDPVHTYADTGYYRVSLISIKGDTCTASYSKLISVQYKRINADFIVEDTACIRAGDLIRFIDRSTDSLNVASWSWAFSNGQNSTAQNPVIQYNGVLDSITATLLVTSVNGCTSTITKTIRLLRKPPYTLDHILTKCSIQSSPINLGISGNNTFSWSPATDLDDPTAQSPNTTTPVNTTYYVTIRSVLANGDTCTQFDSVRVQILNTLQINAGDTISVCKDSVRLSIPLSPGQTVVWSTSNSFIPVIGTTASIVISQTEKIKTYYVKVDAGGCQAIDSIVVVFNDTIPQVTLADNILQCSSQVSLFAQVSISDSIIWSTSPAFQPVIGSGPSYNTSQGTKTVMYYIKATYQTCVTTDSIKVTIQDTLPVITLDDTLEFCSGTVTINANVRNFSTIIWSTSPTFIPVIGTGRNLTISQPAPEQTYYIKAFYRDCFRTDSVVVRYQDTLPTASIIRGTPLFCSDTVYAEAVASNYTDVAWSTNRDFTQILSDSLSFYAYQAQPEQTYYFRARYRFCEAIDSITLFNSKINYNGDDLEKCSGDPLLIDLQVATNSSYEITWTLGDSVQQTQNSSSIPYSGNTSQWVVFEIRNDDDCSVRDSLYITVNPLPAVNADAVPDSVYPGEEVQLLATQDPGYAYQWEPAGQVSNPVVFNPLTYPEETTMYWVTVTDSNNCRNSDSVQVRVLRYICDRGMIFLPNAFTPNGDGVNDVFRPRSEILRTYRLVIYDRWGAKVFESGDGQPGWDGTYKNKPALADSYGYYFEGECPQGEKITIKGNVTLYY